MFSLESFYNVISKNLLEPLCINHYYFEPFGSTRAQDLISGYTIKSDLTNYVIFHDQEPINHIHFEKTLDYFQSTLCLFSEYAGLGKLTYGQHKFLLFANSEDSNDKKLVIKKYDLYDWYYFFHGFAALDWYKNIKYLPPIKSYSKLFLSFNNLFTGNRNYRLILVAKLVEKKLHNFGLISLNQNDTDKKIKNEIFSSDTLITSENRKLIYKNLLGNNSQFIIDRFDISGTLSADDNLETYCKALFHVVTETVFYENKRHLTEKIFKPIVSRRPFLLVSSQHNLAYLQSYGFKTFDRWINESYDSQADPEKRINMIVTELEKLSKLTQSELDTIYAEMQEILEYNFHWFYTGFKEKIVTELVDNFEIATKQYNLNKSMNANDYLDVSALDFDSIKKRLTLGSY